MRGSLEEQIQREKLSVEEGVKRYSKEVLSAIKQGRFTETPYGSLLIKLGFDKYKETLDTYYTKRLHSHNLKDRNYLKVLCDNTEEVAYVVLRTILNTIVSNSVTKLTTVSHDVAYNLLDMYKYNSIVEDNPKLISYLGHEFRRANKRQKKFLLEKNLRELKNTIDVGSRSRLLRLGATLIKLLEDSGANLITTFTYKERNKSIKAIRLTNDAKELIMSVDSKDLAKRMIVKKPLIYPPKDRVSLWEGGYHVLKSSLIRTRRNKEALEFIERQDVSKLLPIVNKLQKVGWRVNKKVYDLVHYLFFNNLEIGGIPPNVVKTAEELVPKPSEHMTKEEFGRWNRERQRKAIELDSVFGKRLELLYALATAEELLPYDSFWYAYQFDYRGRVYPDDSYFNLLKSKPVKCMIEFSEGQYLTPDGVRWLKIHIANTYGLDKQPYYERVSWVDNNYEMLKRIVEDPLTHRGLWQDADSPLEFVAACYAYHAHLSGDKVHLPIQLDATCSGIQMYSGLLLDKVGAKSVNVIGDTRSDIYQQVADKANEMLIANDYDPIVSYTDSEGVCHSILTDKTAVSMRGHITRKLVKRPTMTIPYGVTKRGMQEQIWDELTALKDAGNKFWEGEDWVANNILTDVINRAIYKVVLGARVGQDYLVSLSRSLDRPATWYSPIYNFPVFQAAYKMNEHRVRTLYGSLTINIDGVSVDRRRQANQIAPNFIHSIDATVLLGVIDRSDYRIGTVHDCFLVPPNSGYDVQQHYKEAFVITMEADPLYLLQKQLDIDKEVVFPEYGELNLEAVYESVYIIS